jgi:hypothetical protein
MFRSTRIRYQAGAWEDLSFSADKNATTFFDGT